MKRYISNRLPVALQCLAAQPDRFLRLAEFPASVGPAVVELVVQSGFASTGPATAYPREIGYRITAAGLVHAQLGPAPHQSAK
jgi:hypothetical protein